MSYAAAISEHPVAAEAAGDVVGRVVEQLDGRPDLAVVFVSGSHGRSVGEITATIDSILAPTSLIGVTAVAVLGEGREVEQSPAISLWAARLGTAPAFHLRIEPHDDGHHLVGLPPEPVGTLILLADPFTFPVTSVLDHLARAHPQLEVIGGLASAADRPDQNSLMIGSSIVKDGAVGALLAPGTVQPIVSQGCRPIGQPYIVTRADRNQIDELAGRPAFERLLEIIEELDDADRQLVQTGLQVGMVIDETKLDFGREDFLMRGVVGVDRVTGSISIGDLAPVGSTIQFHVRDAAAADDDLRTLLAGRTGRSALVFTCNGRGVGMFGRPDHDADLVNEAIERGPMAGMFCAGEVGPVGGANHLHGFTASIALFR